MKNRLNSIIIALIFIVPIGLYALLSTGSKDASIASAAQPTVYDFYAPMCSECKELKKNMNIVEPKYENKVNFVKVDVSKNTSSTLVKKYDVVVVPTLVFLDKNGKLIKKSTGNMPVKELESNIERILK